MTRRRLISDGKCLWPVPVLLVALAAIRVGGVDKVAAQQIVPGAAACTALAAPLFPGVATLTATYDAGSGGQPAQCVVRGSA
ncbi:MAG TPA: hypothetical protein VIR54_00045, partial [Vicinamibacterales bacterium]